MKTLLLSVLAILVAIVGIGLIAFVSNSIDFANYAFWEPKKQAVDRKIFENTPSYIQGKNQDLAKYHHEWTIDSSSDNRGAIEALVRQQFGSFDKDKVVDPSLASWLSYCLSK